MVPLWLKPFRIKWANRLSMCFFAPCEALKQLRSPPCEMGWLKETVAPLQVCELTTGANTKTRIRKEQRLHSKLSYLAMKSKLLSLVKPLPVAMQASDLETFRADLYHPISTESPPTTATDRKTDMPQAATCTWCGTWVPLPVTLGVHNELVTTGIVGELGNQPTVDAITSKSAVAASTDPNNGSLNIGELGNQPTVDAITSTTAVAACTDPNNGRLYGELGNQPTVAIFAAVAATADPANISIPQSSAPSPSGDIIDLADLLSPSLCEVVSSIEGAWDGDRRQRVAAFKARGCKPVPAGFSWTGIDVSRHAFCLTLPCQPPLFQKDEATGECKQQ